MLRLSVITSLLTLDSSTQMIVTGSSEKLQARAYPMLHDYRLRIGLSCALPGHMTDPMLVKHKTTVSPLSSLLSNLVYG